MTNKMTLLRGVNWSGLEYDCMDGNTCNKGFSLQDLTNIKNQWNINILRLGFNKADYLNDCNCIYDYNKSYRQAMRDVTSWCKSLGITIILALQWESSIVHQTPLPGSGTAAMWGQLAQDQMYQNSPLVWFDIWGEPHDCTFTDWRNIADQCITEIRKYANNTCLVAGLNWASDLRPWRGNYITQSNVVYDCHAYDPATMGSFAYDLDSRIGGVLSDAYPVFLGEIGANWDQTTNQDWLINYALPWFDGIGRRAGIPTTPLGWTAWGMTNSPNLTIGDGITPSIYGHVIQDKLRQNIACPDPEINITISEG